MMESQEGYQFGRPKHSDGHPPLLLERKGEEIWTTDGRKLMPGFNIGPDPWHLNLFVEYERTFGRGKAFAITHNPISSPTYEKEKHDYLELAGQMPSVVHKGTETDCIQDTGCIQRAAAE